MTRNKLFLALGYEDWNYEDENVNEGTWDNQQLYSNNNMQKNVTNEGSTIEGGEDFVF